VEKRGVSEHDQRDGFGQVNRSSSETCVPAATSFPPTADDVVGLHTGLTILINFRGDPKGKGRCGAARIAVELPGIEPAAKAQ
jgi:hypothetical protein